MPSGKQHLIGGALVGALCNVAKQLTQKASDPNRPFDWGEFAVYALGGGAMGLLADVLEPATTPNHRAFFHSFTFGAVALYAAHGRHTAAWSKERRMVIQTASYCYTSHLFADALTQKGLPLI